VTLRLRRNMRDLSLWQKQEYTGMKPGLARMRRFLRLAGNPQDAINVVHIAGTNGKGSTARMLSHILEKSGYNTGLYISPHLVTINERISINSRLIGPRQLQRLAGEYDRLAKRCSLTFFEFITGLAFIYFFRRKVEIAVLETGLGGRFDATNVVKQPKISIITDVDFDHRQFLGNTLPAIAGEKAGIIKQGCPVVSGVESRAAAKVVRERAGQRRAPLFEVGRDFFYARLKTDWRCGRQEMAWHGLDLRICKPILRGCCRGRFTSPHSLSCSQRAAKAAPTTSLDYRTIKVRLPLLGKYQAKNCALAIEAAQILNRQLYDIKDSSIKAALRDVTWPGRFDVRSIRRGNRRQTVILDGAHNPGAIRQFVAAWDESPFGRGGMSLIFGVLKDKDYKTIVRELAPHADNVVLVPPRSPRALDLEVLAKTWRRFNPGGGIACAISFADALNALRNKKHIAVTGSLYLVGEALEYIHRQKNSE